MWREWQQHSFHPPRLRVWHSQIDGLEKIKIRSLADGGDIILIDIKCHMQNVDKFNWVFSDINQINWHGKFLSLMNIGCCPNQLPFKYTQRWMELTVLHVLGVWILGKKAQSKGKLWSFVYCSLLFPCLLLQTGNECPDSRIGCYTSLQPRGLRACLTLSKRRTSGKVWWKNRSVETNSSRHSHNWEFLRSLLFFKLFLYCSLLQGGDNASVFLEHRWL